MGLFSKLFGKKKENQSLKRKPNQKIEDKEEQLVRKRKGQADVVNVKTEDDSMNWAMEKARLTLHHFEDCLASPKESQQYFSIKVKIVDHEKVEHMWLNSPSFDQDGNLFGVVGNEPIDVKSVKYNQKIGIDRNLISDWMIIENGRLIGGYTIRSIRDNLSGVQLQDFEKNLGGIYIDDGEDYFLPDDATPEGAIVLLETAFNEENIEKAMACKDFRKEAELMLAKIGVPNLNESLIENTAETLKLSFLKMLQDNGIPKFHNIKQAFPKREVVSENHMIITEVCYQLDGIKTVQRLNTYNNGNGWKVLSPAE